MRLVGGRPCATLLCLFAVLPAWADGSFKGELNVEASRSRNAGNSLDAALGERRHTDTDAWLRLMWSGETTSGWSLDTAYVAELRQGGGVALTRREHEALPASYVDSATTAPLLLTRTVSDHGERNSTQRIDRLSLGYSGNHLVLRIGRQALTWGSGLVFHPMDLFNPFAPDATYTAYKPGSDMIYGQWLFDSGADVQGVIVPRRDPATGHVAADQASSGIKWHGFLDRDGRLGADLMLARDYRSKVLGLGLSGSAAGAALTAEIVPTQLPDGGWRTSLLANAQYAWTWGEHNVSAYVELFRNGFGLEGRSHDLTDLPTDLAERLARGEMFTVSRNYLAAGIDLQWTPLFDLKPTLIANLDDSSTLFVAQAIYDLSQYTAVTAGLQWGHGDRGSEYGGLATNPGAGIYVSPAQRIYARFTWYY
jgi:hypothetical protein